MVKTIKELSDEFGVTKQAVRKAIDRLAPTNYQRGINSRIEVDTKGYSILKDYYGESNNQKTKVDDKLAQTDNEEIINILKNELEISHKKNDHQQDQIDHLQKLLENQQVLTLQAQDRVQLLETQKEEQEADIAEKGRKKKWQFWK